MGHGVEGLMGSAYTDAGRTVVAVYVNMGATAETVELGFEGGWPVRWLTPYVTSDRAGDELKAYAAVRVGKPVVIPGRSVVTLVGH